MSFDLCSIDDLSCRVLICVASVLKFAVLLYFVFPGGR